MEEIIGYCKECGKTIFESNFIPEYPNIYECPVCYYPHAKEDLWDVLPDYLRKEGEQIGDL
jgi:hypothetical protein